MRHGLHLQANGSSRSSALATAARRTVARRIRGDPSQKNSMSSWSEATSGVRCELSHGIAAGFAPFSRGSGYGSNFAVHAWARAFCKRWNHFWFPVALPNSVLTPLSTIARPTRHTRAGLQGNGNASSIFVRTSIRLIAHDIAGATPHPSCSSEYGIRS
jgi:hypothetical protein